jgi:hypothetical protein
METLLLLLEKIVLLLLIVLYVYSVEYVGIRYVIRSRRYRNWPLRVSHIVTLYILALHYLY